MKSKRSKKQQKIMRRCVCERVCVCGVCVCVCVCVCVIHNLLVYVDSFSFFLVWKHEVDQCRPVYPTPAPSIQLPLLELILLLLLSFSRVINGVCVGVHASVWRRGGDQLGNTKSSL